MAPVEVAAVEYPAKRRKVRSAGGGAGDDDNYDSSSGGAVAAKKQALKKQQKQTENLSIRGPKRDSPASRLRTGDDGDRADDDSEAPRRTSRRESTDSPSAQLAGALRPREAQSRSRSRSRLDSELRSSRSESSRLSSRSRSPSLQRSQSRSHSRSPSQSRSRSRLSARSGSSSRFSSRSRSRSRPRSHSPSSRRKGTARTGDTNGTEQTTRQRRRRRRRHPESPRPHYRRVLAMRGHDGPISQVRISPDGRWIASASADGTARIWDAATGAHMTTLVGHIAGLSCLAWSPDSNTLATGSDDKSIRLWDRVTAEPAHALVNVDGAVGGGDLDVDDPDGKKRGVAVPSAAANAVRYARRQLREGINGTNGNGSASSGGARGTRLPLLGHHNYVYCLAFSPKGNILASGSYDEAVFLWDVRAGRLMRSLPAHSDPVSGIDFCCDGTLVVSCSTDGLIRIWDTGTGQCLRTLLLLNEDNPAVTNVCFSPNGRYVLAFNLDSCIRLWDYVAQPSIVKKTYQGHVNKGFSIGGCFGVLGDGGGDADAKDSKKYRPFVAAASEDGDVVLWDVGSKAVVQRLRGAHRDGVCFWVDVCGATMVSCGQDGWINVYRHTEEDEDEDEDREGDEVGEVEKNGTDEGGEKDAEEEKDDEANGTYDGNGIKKSSTGDADGEDTDMANGH